MICEVISLWLLSIADADSEKRNLRPLLTLRKPSSSIYLQSKARENMRFAN
jgi:hypothetical protein